MTKKTFSKGNVFIELESADFIANILKVTTKLKLPMRGKSWGCVTALRVDGKKQMTVDSTVFVVYQQ